jgi:hypothetical protein
MPRISPMHYFMWLLNLCEWTTVIPVYLLVFKYVQGTTMEWHVEAHTGSDATKSFFSTSRFILSQCSCCLLTRSSRWCQLFFEILKIDVSVCDRLGGRVWWQGVNVEIRRHWNQTQSHWAHPASTFTHWAVSLTLFKALLITSSFSGLTRKPPRGTKE